MTIDTAFSPFTLTLLFLLLLGDGDVVAGVCSLLWLFVPVGRRAPWNTVRHFEVRVPVEGDSDSEDDEEPHAESQEKTEAEAESQEKTEAEAGTEETKSNIEIVPPQSTSWCTYLSAQ